MNKRELLENYRDIVIEIETLERQSKFLNQFIGGPRPVRAVQLTGMPRGTNDPEAAMLQRADTDDFKSLAIMFLQLELKVTAQILLLLNLHILIAILLQSPDQSLLQCVLALYSHNK